MYSLRRTVASHMYLLRIIRRPHLSLNVLWYIKDDRPLLSGVCYIKGHLDPFGKLFPLSYRRTELDDLARHPDYIHLLKSVISNEGTGNLPREYHKGNRIIMRIRNPCDGIRGSGAACHKADSRFSRNLRVTLSLVDEGLLVPREYDSDVGIFVKLVEKIRIVPARVGEDSINTFFLKRLDKKRAS